MREPIPLRKIFHPQQVDREAGARFAQDIEAEFFEVSAKEGSNIRELFRSVGKFVCVTFMRQKPMSHREWLALPAADSLPPLDAAKDDATDDANALDLAGENSSKGSQKKCC